jgi:molybdenum-dependent DNA-binding transcriptional regulator ModE
MQRVRHDGWTPERQLAFMRVLSVTGQVSVAARTVGISRKSAYKLRDRPDAESFAQAWDIALNSGR